MEPCYLGNAGRLRNLSILTSPLRPTVQKRDSGTRVQLWGDSGEWEQVGVALSLLCYCQGNHRQLLAFTALYFSKYLPSVTLPDTHHPRREVGQLIPLLFHR